MAHLHHKCERYGQVNAVGTLEQLNDVTNALRSANAGDSQNVLDRLLSAPEIGFFQTKIEEYEKLLLGLFEIMEPAIGDLAFIRRTDGVESWVKELVKKCQDLQEAEPEADYVVEVGSFAWGVSEFGRGKTIASAKPSGDSIVLRPGAVDLIERELTSGNLLKWVVLP